MGRRRKKSKHVSVIPYYLSIPREIWSNHVIKLLLSCGKKSDDRKLPEGIKNMRLTCKTFYEVTLPYVSVYITTDILRWRSPFYRDRKELLLQWPMFFSMEAMRVSRFYESPSSLFRDMFLMLCIPKPREDPIPGYLSMTQDGFWRRKGHYMDHQFTRLRECIYTAIASPIIRLILFPNMSQETLSMIEGLFGGWKPVSPHYEGLPRLKGKIDTIKPTLANRVRGMKRIDLEEDGGLMPHTGYIDEERISLAPWKNYRYLILEIVLKEIPRNMPNIKEVYLNAPIPSPELFGSFARLKKLCIHYHDFYDEGFIFSDIRRIFNVTQNPLLKVTCVIGRDVKRFNIVSVSEKEWDETLKRSIELLPEWSRNDRAAKYKAFTDTINYQVRRLRGKISSSPCYKWKRFLRDTGILFSRFFFQNNGVQTIINPYYDEHIPFLRFLLEEKGMDISQEGGISNMTFIEYFIIGYMRDIDRSLFIFPIDRLEEILLMTTPQGKHLIDFIQTGQAKNLREKGVTANVNSYHTILYEAIVRRKWVVAELVLVLNQFSVQGILNLFPPDLLSDLSKAISKEDIAEMTKQDKRIFTSFTTVNTHIFRKRK